MPFHPPQSTLLKKQPVLLRNPIIIVYRDGSCRIIALIKSQFISISPSNKMELKADRLLDSCGGLYTHTTFIIPRKLDTNACPKQSLRKCFKRVRQAWQHGWTQLGETPCLLLHTGFNNLPHCRGPLVSRRKQAYKATSFPSIKKDSMTSTYLHLKWVGIKHPIRNYYHILLLIRKIHL